MATIRQYATRLYTAEQAVCRRMGVDLGMSDKNSRAVTKSLLVLMATIIKGTVDKGLMTDADWEGLFSFAESDATYPDEPMQPPG